MLENVSKIAWCRASLVALVAVLAACDRSSSAAGQAGVARAVVDSMGAVPTAVHAVAMNVRAALTENSAAVMSARQPGVIFTINDSGNEPILYAFDTTGADRGAWRVNGATDVDWESASLGACAGKPNDTTACLYIGDTGDNQAHHRTRAIYRVAEPNAGRTGAIGAVDAERLTYVYEDGPHDVEAMYVARNGDMFLLTKRAIFDSRRRIRPSLVFRLPASAWTERGRVVARLVDSVPIVPGSAPLREITDASLSRDARHLAVRTYTQVFVFTVDPSTGRIEPAVNPAVCNIVSLGERQGEGITWVNDGGRFAFTSEGRAAPLYLATCPLPER